jgi:hypothetical protein
MMNNCCVSERVLNERNMSLDRDFSEAVARGKRERQSVLKQVRRRRALVLKRMAAKIGKF